MPSRFPDLSFTSYPESIQTFDTMLDITASDADLVKNFQEAMEMGDVESAQSYLIQIPNYQQKIITAEMLNKLMQTCVALQRVYGNTNQLSYKSTYSSSTQYYQNNLVLYNNNLYLCMLQPTIGTAPTDTTYWRQL